MKVSNYIPFNGKKLEMIFSIETYDYIPILSVLKDEYMQLYLCLCSEIRGKMRWVVSLTNLDTVQQLVDLDISVNEALRQVQNKVFVIEYCKGEYTCIETSFSEINPLYLTEEGTFAEFQDDDVEENLEQWKQLAERKSAYYTCSVGTNSSELSPEDNDSRYSGNENENYSQKECSAVDQYCRDYLKFSTGEETYKYGSWIFAA